MGEGRMGGMGSSRGRGGMGAKSGEEKAEEGMERRRV